MCTLTLHTEVGKGGVRLADAVKSITGNLAAVLGGGRPNDQRPVRLHLHPVGQPAELTDEDALVVPAGGDVARHALCPAGQLHLVALDDGGVPRRVDNFRRHADEHSGGCPQDSLAVLGHAHVRARFRLGDGL